MTSEIRDVTVVTHSEDGKLWAEVLELPGCFAMGDTADELQQCLEEAIGLYLSDPGEQLVAELKVSEDLTPIRKIPARLAVA
jgi:predicted RNase H-like HicB family nuclease